MEQEGIIKFKAEHIAGEAFSAELLNSLIEFRQKVYKRNWIGVDKVQKIGFGNISMKKDGRVFVSGTQTGIYEKAVPKHFCEILEYDIERNYVKSFGPVQASSETMTHLAIYEADSEIKAVIHIHDGELWQKEINTLPTTSQEIEYGTVEMANAIKKITLEILRDDTRKMIIMGGHEAGILSFGRSLDVAFSELCL